MYYVIVKVIATGKIVDKVEISTNKKIPGEVPQLARIAKEQCVRQIPSCEDFNIYQINRYSLNSFNKLEFCDHTEKFFLSFTKPSSPLLYIRQQKELLSPKYFMSWLILFRAIRVICFRFITMVKYEFLILL